MSEVCNKHRDGDKDALALCDKALLLGKGVVGNYFGWGRQRGAYWFAWCRHDPIEVHRDLKNDR